MSPHSSAIGLSGLLVAATFCLGAKQSAKSGPATISHMSAHSAKDKTSENVAGCETSLLNPGKNLASFFNEQVHSLEIATKGLPTWS